jgi:Tfp pilus assembly protein FimV
MSTALISPALISPALISPLRITAATGTSSAPSAPTRLRLTRRGRAVITALVAFPLVVGAGIFAINGGGAAASGDASDASFSHVTVSSGQSLWQIAERVAPNADPRDVVSAIVDLNQLPDSTVMPGERLAIPAQYSR